MADKTPAPGAPREGERIAKLLARAGIASRREVERMIADGRVRLGEEVLTTPNTVLPNLKGVTVDGKPVKAPEPPRLFVFHKPSGLITAERDPAGRPTIYTALRNALPAGTPRLMPIGRLDLNTEGLLLLTNDGELKRAMELPSSGVPRTYRARTFGEISQAQLEDLIEGVEIEGVRYGRIDANMERRTGRNQWIELTITEGKNREIRRVLEHLGLEVSRLIRTSYGPFQLLDLPRGAALEIRQVDVEKFRRALKGGGTVDAVVPVPQQDHRQAAARIRRSGPGGAPRKPADDGTGGRPSASPRGRTSRRDDVAPRSDAPRNSGGGRPGSDSRPGGGKARPGGSGRPGGAPGASRTPGGPRKPRGPRA